MIGKFDISVLWGERRLSDSSGSSFDPHNRRAHVTQAFAILVSNFLPTFCLFLWYGGGPYTAYSSARCLIWIGPALCTICVCFNSVCVLFWELFSSLSGVQ